MASILHICVFLFFSVSFFKHDFFFAVTEKVWESESTDASDVEPPPKKQQPVKQQSPPQVNTPPLFHRYLKKSKLLTRDHP